MDSRVESRIKEAERFLRAAFEEFNRGLNLRSDETLRDAAEKAWNAIVKATEALLLASGYSEDEIRTYRDKRLKLDELAGKNERIRNLNLRDRFMAREYNLHIRCFYDGEYTIEGLKEDLEKAREYIEDIKKVITESS